MNAYALVFMWPAILETFACYALIIACGIAAWRRLRRNRLDPMGLVCGVVVLVFPVLIVAEAMTDHFSLAAREREIRSWPRISVPDTLPRALIIEPQMRGGEYPDYVLAVAESGLFDVFVRDRRESKMLRAEVAARSDCAERRTKENRFAAMVGFTRCASLVAVQSLPDNALTLYEGPWQAPLAPRSLGRPGDPFRRVNWALQLSLRHGSSEELVAYEESIRRKQLIAHPLVGVRYVLEPHPMRRISSGVSVGFAPRADDFLYRTLGIDPKKIQPPGALDRERLEQAIEHLVSAGDVPSTKALGQIVAAHPDRDSLFASALTRVMANPATAGGLFLYPIDCDYVAALERYKVDISEGCEANPKSANRSCGATTTTTDWFEMCSGSEQPVWSTADPSHTRVAVSLVFTDLKATVSVAGRRSGKWGIVEVVVPNDRGMIDIAFYDEHIWHFSGAVSCVGQVTVIGDRAAVLGLPREKVQFKARERQRYIADGYNGPRGSLSPDFLALLGSQPDVSLVDHRESTVDLSTLIPVGSAKVPCAPGPQQDRLAVSPENVVDVDPAQLVTLPMIVPVHAN